MRELFSTDDVIGLQVEITCREVSHIEATLSML